MHEIVKYFILTEIQEQCLNPMPEPLIGPGRPAEVLSICNGCCHALPQVLAVLLPVVLAVPRGAGRSERQVAAPSVARPRQPLTAAACFDDLN